MPPGVGSPGFCSVLFACLFFLPLFFLCFMSESVSCYVFENTRLVSAMSEPQIPFRYMFLSRRHIRVFFDLPFSPHFVHVFSAIEHLEHFTIMSANSTTWIDMNATGSVSNDWFSSSSGLHLPLICMARTLRLAPGCCQHDVVGGWVLLQSLKYC